MSDWPPKLASLSLDGLERRQKGLEEYAQLKAEWLKNTALFGAGLSLYLLLAQHDVAMAASSAVGATGSVAYAALACVYVDRLGPGVRALPPVKGPLAKGLGTLALNAVKRLGDVYWCVRFYLPICVRARAGLEQLSLSNASAAAD